MGGGAAQAELIWPVASWRLSGSFQWNQYTGEVVGNDSDGPQQTSPEEPGHRWAGDASAAWRFESVWLGALFHVAQSKSPRGKPDEVFRPVWARFLGGGVIVGYESRRSQPRLEVQGGLTTGRWAEDGGTSSGKARTPLHAQLGVRLEWLLNGWTVAAWAHGSGYRAAFDGTAKYNINSLSFSNVRWLSVVGTAGMQVGRAF
jgi:hypothetical protein